MLKANFEGSVKISAAGLFGGGGVTLLVCVGAWTLQGSWE